LQIKRPPLRNKIITSLHRYTRLRGPSILYFPHKVTVVLRRKPFVSISMWERRSNMCSKKVFSLHRTWNRFGCDHWLWPYRSRLEICCSFIGHMVHIRGVGQRATVSVVLEMSPRDDGIQLENRPYRFRPQHFSPDWRTPRKQPGYVYAFAHSLGGRTSWDFNSRVRVVVLAHAYESYYVDSATGIRNDITTCPWNQTICTHVQLCVLTESKGSFERSNNAMETEKFIRSSRSTSSVIIRIRGFGSVSSVEIIFILKMSIVYDECLHSSFLR
jgi:hypothetical protein